MKSLIKKLLKENLTRNSIEEFLSNKPLIIKNSKIKGFLYHGTQIEPSEFKLSDDYNASEETGNGSYMTDIPDGVIFLTNDIKEALAYGRYIIPCELQVKHVKIFKINSNSPSIVWDDDFSGYSNYGMYSALEENEVVVVKGISKSTYVAYVSTVIPRIDLALEYYNNEKNDKNIT